MIAAVAHTQTLWYLTRGSGLVSLVLLTGSVVLGILQVKRWSSTRWPRFVTSALHKNVSLLAVVFLGLHIATTVLDGFAPIGWIDVVLPFHSPYRPLWLGLGAVAVDLLLALVVTSLLRGRIGYRTWKAIHWTAYGCWPVAILHGMGTGTDTRLGLVLALYAGCLAAVVCSVWWRLADTARSRVAGSGVVVAAGVASVAVPLGIVVFLLAGPLRPGWSQRAGTPRVATAAAGAAAPAAVVAPAGPAGGAVVPAGGAVVPAGGAPSGTDLAVWSGPFTDSFAGTVVSSSDGTSVTIDGTLSGSAPGHLRVVLQGQPASGGGIAMTASSATVGPPGQPTLYEGSVRSLAGSRLRLALSGPGGGRIDMRVLLNLGGSSNVTGSVSSATATQGVGGDD